MEDNTKYFYFTLDKYYTICDTEFCAKSERTIDISLYDLANNESLLNELSLVYIYLKTPKKRFEWFCSYISSFRKTSEMYEGCNKKALTNPTVRLLVMDEELLIKVKSILCV